MNRLMGADHIVPMPAVAGWTEDERTAHMARIRADVTNQGGVVVWERRVRNDAFDARGERTTWTFGVEFPEP